MSPQLWSVFTNDLQEHCPIEIKHATYSPILESKNKQVNLILVMFHLTHIPKTLSFQHVINIKIKEIFFSVQSL